MHHDNNDNPPTAQVVDLFESLKEALASDARDHNYEADDEDLPVLAEDQRPRRGVFRFDEHGKAYFVDGKLKLPE
jgi:hypothetical protein